MAIVSSIWIKKYGINFFNLLEWCLNSPPKPHAFVSLPLQSKIKIFSNLNLLKSKRFSLTLFFCFIMLLSLFEMKKAFFLFQYCDAPRPWGIYFQDSATPQMEGLVELHDNILFYLVIVLFGVGWILLSFIVNNINKALNHKNFHEATLIELIWAITPAFILILMLILLAFPSFKLLYLMVETSDPAMSVLAEGHSYQNADFLNSDINSKHDIEVEKKVLSPLKRFLTFNYNYFPSYFQPTIVHSFIGSTNPDIVCMVKSFAIFDLDTGSDSSYSRYVERWTSIDSEYEDESRTSGDSIFDPGREAVVWFDLWNHDYLVDDAEHFGARTWYHARVSRYCDVCTLLWDQVNSNNEIIGNIRELTDNEIYSFKMHYRGPNAPWEYNELGPVTRLLMKTRATRLLLKIRSEVLAVQRAILEDPFTQS